MDDLSNTFATLEKPRAEDVMYYLVRPKDSYIVYLMATEPDYFHEPFYKAAKEEHRCEDYLCYHAEYSYDSDDLASDIGECLEKMNLFPNENEIKYVLKNQNPFSEERLQALLSTCSYYADKVVAEHYRTHNWHIKDLLEMSPFKEYIQEHYPGVPKGLAVKTAKPLEEMAQERKEFFQNRVNELNNKRLLL